MKLVTFQKPGGQAEPGVLLPDGILGLRGAGFSSLVDVLAGGVDARAQVDTWVAKRPAEALVPAGAAKLLAPIPRPPKLICVGLNYRDHAIEAKMEMPKVPTIFNKFPSAVIGPDAPIVLPRNSSQPDYEAEFAFVIGKSGRHIPAERWQDYVYGYTIVNDVSARDFQMATSQWFMGKTFDTFAPMGPVLVTADEIPDPHQLDISLTVNGEVLQSSNTRELIFKLPELVAFLSSVFTLEPGDVVSTGTPAGVGFARKPPRYLQPGDQVAIQVQGIGELRNPVVAEAMAAVI
ncbi:MAG TPA: fumarylacetoacetate hydrolase family protein [Bryobacteraceae bacterium]|nr:fumarylacetoacetate hydrolase family protein [Bryobacteraceae bacterium]